MYRILKIAGIGLITTILSYQVTAQIAGCTDKLAENYNVSATINDGSCFYKAVSVSPENAHNLPASLNETSGLIIWKGKYWTHNDDTDLKLYSIDTADISNLSTSELTSCTNNDWEEITQDENYIYMGDFGNNSNGNRKNLNILRIDKSSILQNKPVADTILFKYSLQTDFSPTGGNNTDFDCEAMIASDDSIYLFTKEWISKKSTLYAIPKTPGSHMAKFISTYNVQGLVTGATYLQKENLVALSGYNQLLQPFVYLLYDFQGNDFFSGNKRKINLNIPLHQVEGIATEDGLKYILTNEKFTQSIITIEAKLHQLDLSSYTSHYIESGTLPSADLQKDFKVSVIPNPASSILQFNTHELTDFTISIYNFTGQIMESYTPKNPKFDVDLNNFSKGVYFFQVKSKSHGLISGKFIVE